ncbi:factor H binding protein domain-containing protein [Acinetobacter larvae]|uniref:Factor H binding protein-like C-terminal domain-containing protein n=1 Tax=Acinetobacter larvae TaxID=1789224 RepID=A0A1B2LXR9_9GAMM|nr:factor H binding protein domain-containing protein [Acinetobacter larvae]AOA57748.1 hypothetical protein BFG52_04840 [Acinetobacter larvae]
MLNKSLFKMGLIAASIFTASLASADVGFGQSLQNFTFDNKYQGTFSYNNKVYGAGSTNVDLSSLPYGTNGFYRTSDNSIYRIYKQSYSAVIGNITPRNADRSFIRDVAGEATLASTLPAQASYNYTGTVFNHIEGTEGQLNYNVNVNGSTVKGSGSFTGVTGNRPGVGPFELSGTLHEVNFTASGGKLNPASGSASLNIKDVASNQTESLSGSKYDIGLYGPNAAEVAGAIHGGQLEALIGGYGIAGTKNP